MLASEKSATFRDHALEILEAQHIRHRIDARRLAAPPERGLQRPAGEDLPVLRLVDELDALGGARKDHAVVAHHGAAAQTGKADITGLPSASVTVPALHAVLREI